MIGKEEKQYLTKEKLKEFIDELDFLKTTRRKEVAHDLEYAKALGDLAENAEYQEARELQANVEDRILKLEMIIKSAEIVSDRHGDVVGIGSTVVVQKADEKDNHKYKIVGSEEADMTHGKISNLSPIGSALIGKKKGEAFKVKTPKGEIQYKVIAIE
jgi:transcription elongation factor GreA